MKKVMGIVIGQIKAVTFDWIMKTLNCFALIAIAVTLLCIYRNMPHQVTARDIRNKTATYKDIPLVAIDHGNVSIDGSIDVSGNVDADVNGSVSLDRY